MERTTNTPQFRQALIDHAALVRPLFCFFPFPVTMDLVATATTDECGHFRAFFFRDCGVLEYTPATAMSPVLMPYTASHPHGFATYSFSLYRGVNLLTPPSVSGVPVGAGSFSASETVSNLLGGCTVAGFSENLYVAAMATDGWSRLSGYDASRVRAFVLARPGPGGP